MKVLRSALPPAWSRRRTPAMFYVGAALVVVMLAVVVWTLADARRAVKRQAQQQASNIALTLERDIARTVGTLDLSLRAAVSGMAAPGLAQLAPALRQSILFDGAIGANDIGGVFITDETGRVIYDSLEPSAKPIDLSDRAFFHDHQAHPDLGLRISRPLRGRSDGQLGIDLTRRINHADGSFAGVAAVQLRLSYFKELFSGIDVGSDGILVLLAADGWMIERRPLLENQVGADVSAGELFRHLSQSVSGDYEAVSLLDHVARFVHYERIAGAPLILAVGLSKQQVFADWSRKAAIICVVLLVLSAVTLALAARLRQQWQWRFGAEAALRRATQAAQATAEELAHALAPIEALFRNSVDTMLVVRCRPDGCFVYEAVNPVWEQLIGVPAQAAIGCTAHDCLPPDVADRIVAGWRECAQERRAARLNIEFPTGSGREWEVMVLPIIGKDGTVDRVVVVGREVTERNRLAEELRQAQKAEDQRQANKMEMLGQLAAGVSHDFNNILQVIAGGIEMLRDEKTLSPPARTLLDMIDKASHRGSYLTHHLLAYARKQTLNPKLLDIAEVLEQLSVVLSRTLGTDIVVTTEFISPVGFVRADRSQLETALMNLAINASHAMPGGGSLRFEVRTAEAEPFGEVKSGRYVVIAVIDTGTGMTPDVMARIFDPFFTTKGLEGTGLGLPMVQGFSRQSGGDVRVISALGEGTRFEIWLPEADPEQPQKKLSRPAGTGAGGGRVLLVDDAKDVLITLTAFLRKGAFEVATASGGPEALALLQSGERYDVLITDYMMPLMKGPELIRQARQIQRDLPAVVISGYADAATFLTDLPGVALLRKPFQRDELIAQASALVAQARLSMASQPDGDA